MKCEINFSSHIIGCMDHMTGCNMKMSSHFQGALIFYEKPWTLFFVKAKITSNRHSRIFCHLLYSFCVTQMRWMVINGFGDFFSLLFASKQHSINLVLRPFHTKSDFLHIIYFNESFCVWRALNVNLRNKNCGFRRNLSID